MPFAIELYFDAVGDGRIRALWNALVSCGVRPEHHNASRPHLSLAVCEEIDLGKAAVLVEELALANERFPVVFPAFGIFPGARSVLYLAPQVTPELLAMHRRFLSGFRDVSLGMWDHYRVERWNPHCTLATRIPHARLAGALEVCRAFELPLECTVVEVGIAALRPVKLQFVAPFRSGVV